MVDRYQQLTNSRAAAGLARRLGLPPAPVLPRFVPGGPVVAGSILVGGAGRLRAPAVAVIAAVGGEPVTSATQDVPLGGAVFDATSITSVDQLGQLRSFFGPLMRSLRPGGRLVVLASPPEAVTDLGERISQRALEGFTRTLAKEIGRGGTAQLVYVGLGAEDRLASTLTFLLSAKSAYVSGQVIRIGTQLADPGGAGSWADLARPSQGRVVLITGASRGIGAEIARTLHRDGATIIAVDVAQAASALQDVVDSVEGTRVIVDVTSVDAPQRLARAVAESHGGLDVVIHNAGITRDKKLANMTADRWGPVLDVNLLAPQRITAELMLQGLLRPNGRVIAISSIAGVAGNLGQANYATSKAGIIGLVDGLVAPAAAEGITVNAVAPGFIETQMTASLPLMIRAAGRRMSSLGQGGLPIDVAETIAWLADPASFGVTGNTVRVCGQSMLGA